MSHTPPARRTDAIDWPGVSTSLDAQGWAILPTLLTGESLKIFQRCAKNRL
jgi:hypothetical protein